jgi:hypothetical protein
MAPGQCLERASSTCPPAEARVKEGPAWGKDASGRQRSVCVCVCVCACVPSFKNRWNIYLLLTSW